MPVINNDPFGGIKGEKGSVNPSPAEVRTFHTRADVDAATTAMHHTLGTKRNQATAGDHVHDGRNSRLIGSGTGATLTGVKTAPTLAQLSTVMDNLVILLKKYIEITDSRT